MHEDFPYALTKIRVFVYSFSYEKNFVHVTTLTKYVLNGLRTFVYPYKEWVTNKKIYLQGILRKTKKKNYIEFAKMTRCTNNVEHL